MGLRAAVIAVIAHKGVVGATAVGIHRLDVDGRLRDVLPATVEETDVERVVTLVQTRAYPVEVDEFAVLMLVEMETCRQLRGTEVGVEGDARMQAGFVQPKLAVFVLQEHVLQRLPFAHVETLEGLALQFQGLVLHLQFALRVGIVHYVLQLISLAR